jgi:hypothetical protein
MHIKEMYRTLCNPAKFYLILSIIAIIIMIFQRVKAMVILFKLLFAGIFVLLLNFLCKKGYTTLAWVVVLLPYVFLFFALSNVLLR